MKISTSSVRSQGISMKPLIPHGALVQINFSVKKYSIGDIVVFYHNQQFLIHRIIATLPNDNFLIKGDNNNMADGIFQIRNILGKVIAIDRPGRNINFTKFPNKQLKYIFIVTSWAKLLVSKIFT